MNIPMNKDQKKYRNLALDNEDLEKLIELIDRDVYLVGYSLGAIRLCHFLGSDSKIVRRVRKAFVGYVEFDPEAPFSYSRRLAVGFGN